MKRVLTICLVATLAAVGCAKPIQWQTFTSKDGRYSIQMPGTPTSQSQQVKGLTMHVDKVELGDSAYAVSYIDAAAGVKPDLDGAVKGSVNGAKGELIQSKEITIEGKPGREFSFKAADKVGSSRIFADGNRLYQILVVGSTTAIGSDNVQKFFTSFKLEK